MRTSATQFKTLVNFMEYYGDLNKPAKTSRDKVKNLQYWDTLTNLLNSDASGEVKTTEQWKIVWSDLKSNIKKKAHRIKRAASGTGSGPALHTKLSDLEERVLTILGSQAAIGSTGEVEAGFSQVQQNDGTDRSITLSPTSTPPASVDESPSIIIIPGTGALERIVPDDRNNPRTSNQPHISLPAPHISPILSETNDWNGSGISHHQNPSPTSQTPPPVEASSRPEVTPPVQSPQHLQRAGPRWRRGPPFHRARLLRRRLLRPQRHIQEAIWNYLSSDEEWREFLKKKHGDEIEIERERLRIREMELQGQQAWQNIARFALSTLDNISRH